jgi:hypothetical protein
MASPDEISTPEPSADPRPPIEPARIAHPRLLLAGLVLILLGGALAWLFSANRSTVHVGENDSLPPPPVSSSPYRNTTAEAHYVGSEACYQCHAEAAAAYLRTGMGQSMTLVNAAQAPPDATVDHPRSGRRYRVYRKDGTLYHREMLRTAGPDEVILSDVPVKYIVGSGEHAFTYLAEVDGFLVESPLSWYKLRHTWDVSPGYDNAEPTGFSRPVTEYCLRCHAGRAEAIEGTEQKIRFHELAVGCERCHGPGSLHVERQSQPDVPRSGGHDGQLDDTIVNPRRLPRLLGEAVCQQCHLQGQCIVAVRGRRFADFRPGLPLQDSRVEYQVRQFGVGKWVTGHVAQLHASACYQKSSDMTCMTCHNPHGFPKPEERVGYYRAICQNCHEHRQPCTNPAALDAKNGCVKCHMPSGSVDVAHVAFTHHRIGLHPDRKHPPSAAPDVRDPDLLQPYHDLSHFSALDRQRCLALAYLQASEVPGDPGACRVLKDRGVSLLNQVVQAGLRDATVDTALCQLSVGGEPAQVVSAAQRALSHADLPAGDRGAVLYNLATARYRQGDYRHAVEALSELKGLRRNWGDWVLLADCYAKLGEREEEVRALESAAAILPTLAVVQEKLAKYYEEKGDRTRAEEHRRRAVGH